MTRKRRVPAARAVSANTLSHETNAALERDPAGYTAMFSVLDRSMHAQLGRWTFGLSPRAAISAYLDWASGVVVSPGKQAQLLHKRSVNGCALSCTCNND